MNQNKKIQENRRNKRRKDEEKTYFLDIEIIKKIYKLEKKRKY